MVAVPEGRTRTHMPVHILYSTENILLYSSVGGALQYIITVGTKVHVPSDEF